MNRASESQSPTSADDFRTVMQALKNITARIPQIDAARDLSQLYRLIAAALCDHLKQTGNENPNAAAMVASWMADGSTKIAAALVDYVTAHPEATRLIIEGVAEWPVLASTNPAIDIRRVERRPDGPAAKFYKPVLESLGRRQLLGGGLARDPGIFHEVAREAVQAIHLFFQGAAQSRSSGLPWLLDYQYDANTYELSDGDPRSGDKREWVIALKYYLYLTLAPEPERTKLQQAWRAARLEAFTNLHCSGKAAKLKEKLLAQEPPSYPANFGNPLEWPSFPYMVHVRDSTSGQPNWLAWWEENLQYEPAALFGNLTSLVDRDSPAVTKIVRKNSVGGRPIVAFGLCVNAVLDAFLHLCGVAEGLKSVESSSNRIPRITVGK